MRRHQQFDKPGNSTLLAVILIVMSNVISTGSADTTEEVYDFIVVGAGSAGAPVAARLSENPNWKVLLLEAGGEPPEVSKVPLLASVLQKNPAVNWMYKTQPQPGVACLGMEGGQSLWHRGKCLGGTSILNFMTYVRGNKKDFDRWESEGNPGWSYEDVLPYFKKAECNKNPEYAKTKWHGNHGPLIVEDNLVVKPFITAHLESASEMGEKIVDGNGEQQRGFGATQFVMNKGQRWGTNRAYLDPVKGRPNFTIKTYAHVLKIIIDEKSKTAKGVLYEQNGMVLEARTTKEVILSAGAINSPQLLLLSGIGPRKHLEDIQIPVIIDLPGVGNNLQDHPSVTGLMFLVDEGAIINFTKALSAESFLQWLSTGTGDLTLPGGLDGAAWLNTKYSQDPDWPDIEILSSHGSILKQASSPEPNYGLNKKIWTFYNTHYQEASAANKLNYMMRVPILMRPYSRGSIKLNSTNPKDYPIINANYFTDERDLKTLIEGMKLTIKISETKAMKKIGAVLFDKKIPGCDDENGDYTSDKHLECHARHLTSTGYHYSGTCKMGPQNDTMAVVDNKLKVHGIQGLRVADASIMPYIISGHPHASCVMIGERVADFIKEEYK